MQKRCSVSHMQTAYISGPYAASWPMAQLETSTITSGAQSLDAHPMSWNLLGRHNLTSQPATAISNTGSFRHARPTPHTKISTHCFHKTFQHAISTCYFSTPPPSFTPASMTYSMNTRCPLASSYPRTACAAQPCHSPITAAPQQCDQCAAWGRSGPGRQGGGAPCTSTPRHTETQTHRHPVTQATHPPCGGPRSPPVTPPP